MARESIEVLKECEAFLEGHFLLSSGRHSGAYCQMAYLQQYPDKCAEVMAHVAEKLKDTDVDVIVGPAMGGIVYAYELGRQLGKRAIFTERVDNVMTLNHIVDKPTFGSYMLPSEILDELMAHNKAVEDIEKIVIYGYCTDICVISNAMVLRAAFPETEIEVLSDCCAGVTPQSHQTALDAMRACQFTII